VVAGQRGAWRLTADATILSPTALVNLRQRKTTSNPHTSIPQQRTMTPKESHLQQQMDSADRSHVLELQSELDILTADIAFLVDEHAKAIIERDDARLKLNAANMNIEKQRIDFETFAIEQSNTGEESLDEDTAKEYELLLQDYQKLGILEYI